MRNNLAQIVLIPLLIFIALRVPSVFESYWYGDEGIYAAVANEMFQGKKLYQEVWDHKPPLIFLIYYFGAATGWDMSWPLLKVFNILLGILTILAIYFTLLKLNFSKIVIFLGLLFLSVFLGSTVLEGNSLNAEVVFILFNTIAFLLLIYKRYFVAVGFLLFMSLITKVPGFVEMALVLVTFSVYFWKKRGVVFVKRFIVKTFIGFIIPFTVLLLYFYFQNSLNDFVYANLTFNTTYSLHEVNYLSVFNIQVPKTLLKLLSISTIFLVSSYWYWKKRLPEFTFLIINLFAAQVFSSLLSGKNYGHYFIQILPGATLMLSLFLQRLREKPDLLQFKTATVFFILFLPLCYVFISVGKLPIYAPLKEYYPAFYKGYILDDNDKKVDFWWRNGIGIQKTINFSNHFNQDYLEYETAYIYTDKPWVIALVKRQITNKYIVWFHLSYQAAHLEEGLLNIKNSELVVVDNDIDLLEPVAGILLSDFEKIRMFENFDIYKKR